MPNASREPGCWWDTDDPYSYLADRSHQGSQRYAIFGGEDHKTGQQVDTRAPYRRLVNSFRSMFPSARISENRWSGQVIETIDGLPYIGETASRQFAATGYSGNGMTFGTLAAMMARDAFLGRRNPWTEIFDVHRKKLLGGTWNYVSENSDYPYYMARNWLGKKDKGTLSEVRPGQGRVLKIEGKRVAVHRAADGKVSMCSAVCTHLQCIVDWNSAEQTWDCPCHGSRFKPTGEVIAGPAEEPLEAIPAPTAATQAARRSRSRKYSRKGSGEHRPSAKAT